MNSQYDMVFYPQDLEYVPGALNELLSNLKTAGFIGDSFAVPSSNKKSEPKGYLIGEDFLKLITFLGCSPHIEVTPSESMTDGGNFCYIEILQFQKPKYFKGLNHPKCSCPQCKSRVTKVLPELEQWIPDSQWVSCPKCRQNTLTENLNWRHSAGFGQFFIVVHSIYPNEAVPTDKLMNLLRSVSHKDWDYFYYEQ